MICFHKVQVLTMQIQNEVPFFFLITKKKKKKNQNEVGVWSHEFTCYNLVIKL